MTDIFSHTNRYKSKFERRLFIMVNENRTDFSNSGAVNNIKSLAGKAEAKVFGYARVSSIDQNLSRRW